MKCIGEVMTEQETKQRVYVAFSAYATHKKKEVPIDYWLETQDMKRNNPVVSKRYKTLCRK